MVIAQEIIVKAKEKLRLFHVVKANLFQGFLSVGTERSYSDKGKKKKKKTVNKQINRRECVPPLRGKNDRPAMQPVYNYVHDPYYIVLLNRIYTHEFVPEGFLLLYYEFRLNELTCTYILRCVCVYYCNARYTFAGTSGTTVFWSV